MTDNAPPLRAVRSLAPGVPENAVSRLVDSEFLRLAASGRRHVACWKRTWLARIMGIVDAPWPEREEEQAFGTGKFSKAAGGRGRRGARAGTERGAVVDDASRDRSEVCAATGPFPRAPGAGGSPTAKCCRRSSNGCGHRWLNGPGTAKLQEELRSKTYCPKPLLRVWIPKSNGGQRPLGIPAISDRVAQMALLLVIGPIFEDVFCPEQYGFRPGVDAKMAIRRASAEAVCVFPGVDATPT